MNFHFKIGFNKGTNMLSERGTYQVQVFAGLTEKETFHAVLLGLVYNMMECGIATSAKKQLSKNILYIQMWLFRKTRFKDIT